jgi:hypothetical protein
MVESIVSTGLEGPYFEAMQFFPDEFLGTVGA